MGGSSGGGQRGDVMLQWKDDAHLKLESAGGGGEAWARLRNPIQTSDTSPAHVPVMTMYVLGTQYLPYL